MSGCDLGNLLKIVPFKARFVRGLFGTDPATPPLNPPRPPRLLGRFGIEVGSNQEIDVELTLNRCQIGL